MKTLLIKNGLIVTETETIVSDLYIQDGSITEVAFEINKDADHIIDATDQFILPGGIDVHTHMNLPVMGINASDDFFTGTKAALFGGTTTIIDFANQVRGQSLFEAYNRWHQMADQQACCNWGLHVSVTDVTKNTLVEVEKLIKEEGVTSFKTFLAYDALKLPIPQLETLMKHVGRLGGLITSHAEIGEMIANETEKLKLQGKFGPSSHPKAHPESAEIEAVKVMIELSKKTNCPVYFVHVSSAKALEMISRERINYPHLFVESCPQYLFLHDEVYNAPFDHAKKYVMSPPLRSKQCMTAMWQQLTQKRIDVVATDHCPFNLAQKDLGLDDFTKIPNGAPGVEDRIKLLFSEGVMTRLIDITHLARITSTNPAKLFGLYPQKGCIQLGSDADLVIIDPNYTQNISSESHHMRCDYNCYEDKKVQGKIQTVILNGEIVVKGDKFLGHPGMGKYLKRDLPTWISL